MVRCCARCSTKSWAINFLPRHDDRTPLPIALTSHVAHTAPVKSAAFQTPALVLNLRRTTRWCRNIRHSPTMYYNTSLPSYCRHFHSNHPPRPSIIIVVVVAEYNSPHPRISDQESTTSRLKCYEEEWTLWWFCTAWSGMCVCGCRDLLQLRCIWMKAPLAEPINRKLILLNRA